MSKSSRSRRKDRGLPIGRNRHISVRSARRTQPDLKKFAHAIVALALAQAEAEAQAQRHSAGGSSPESQVEQPGRTPEDGDER